jgi:glycosyltransferase involved in cell wall biosynthesis
VTRRRIAIVTPWYGPEATGGAETLARELASQLAVTDDVTILTTTSRSFLADWSENSFKAGRTRENGYDILRFRLGTRDNQAFHRLNGELLRMPREEWPALARRRATLEAFIDESINAPLLEDYLRSREAATYDAVVFLPYLYGVVIRGIEAFPGRAHVIPCLHDEVYARLPRIEDAVHQATSLLFNSEGEAELALRIYGPGILHKSHVIGTGIAMPASPPAAPVIDGPYYLFLGRRDTAKGVDLLVEAFTRYRDAGARQYSLVLAGPGNDSYDDPERGVVDLGFVDEGTKLALLRGARALVQPSLNESYSRVIMEAWRENVPVIARTECLATATAVQRSGGGITAAGAHEWADAFSRLAAASPAELGELGRRGAEYAAAHADWSQVIERFRNATGLTASAPARRGKRVDQVVETLAYGDAISDYARGLRSHLRAQGYDAGIFARAVLPRVAGEAEPLTPTALATSDAVLYHHSIAFKDIELVLGAPGTKALIYHNITPSRFFQKYDAEFGAHLERGRAQLAQLTGTFTACAADSEFNAAELRELGFHDVTVAPVPVNFARFDVTPSPLPAADGAQWLFVGRISPNKGLLDVIAAFEAYTCLDPAARLILAGAYDGGDRYYQELVEFVLEHNLEENVLFAGVVDEATLTAHYRNATLYICLSEHEGFCVPLVEAMYFDLPIIARAATAIVETMGDCGLLVDAGTDPLEIAVLARELVTDENLRAHVIASQRERRAAFRPDRVLSVMDAFVRKLI